MRVAIGDPPVRSVDPRAVDHVHHYEYLAREDLLDYETGDFYSIRVLEGVNASDGPSAFAVYSESSEVKGMLRPARPKQPQGTGPISTQG